ncbi:hypothetical protein [Leptotrichia sp. OH3620_COT-345]|uniref:hypothetical protein n=1 Tax=Leptotrichia sp. OH3620_COT-345 TaxID=2491048 RepID=UPI0013153CFD|nr:hypothetical protein [Leptotrichia sp. OH3620_COT-345]
MKKILGLFLLISIFSFSFNFVEQIRKKVMNFPKTVLLSLKEKIKEKKLFLIHGTQ